MSRYWLIKAPDPSIEDTAIALIASLFGTKDQHKLRGIEVVEIIPENRTANWMEVALVEHLAKIGAHP